ncbi:AMP-binding protein [Streptomyces sp. NBC_01136]|uniref:AMP-binding protein n=1 Tax=Streptomyces sp. NBC_01136 TaxID=2903754 RepID=UPI003867439F|nr:AMP-binding protein [Streptomyces sp. NBC_01136]WST81790.1 AMP-binding protein [Streptomyces sp. NBC_01136]
MFRADLIRPLHELLAGHAARRPQQTAFCDGLRSVTYAELDRRTARVAGHLVGLGLERGARAVIYLPNRVETVESYLAITRASAVGVPLNPRSTDAELAYLLDDCAARVVITGAAQLSQVRRVLAERPGISVVAVSDFPEGEDEDLPRYETLATTWSLRDPPRDDLGLDEPAWMLYTSGTTGRPKGVLSTQRSSLWATGACNAPVLGLSPEDRVLWPMPLFHAVAHNVGVLGVLAVGATARITDGLAADEILRTAREERSTFLVGVPTMYHHMVEQVRSGDFDAPHLRVCMVAGSSCPVSLHEGFRAAFGIALLDSYGSTETGGAITTNLPQGPYVPGSCGLPVPGLTLRLTNPRTGAEVPDGDEGEIWVSSPALMLGYHGQPEATAAVLSDGWYRTGDLARQDDAGYVTITGRLKELIIRGGENIHPGEVEKVLAQVEGVADAAVGAKPHEALGEVPVAYLVPGPGGIDPDAVLAACRAQLSYFKVPEELHEIDAVPRNPAGKIARKRLGGLSGRLLWRRSPTSAQASRRYEGALELGLLGAAHPLLEATVELPDTDGVLFCGRLSGTERDPLLSRTVAGTAVVAPAVLTELALHAGGYAGCGRLLELSTDEPLVLPERDGVQLRVAVGAAGAQGVRTVAVHARRDGGGAAGRPWTCHASGTLAPGTGPSPAREPAVWPPAGSRRVPLEELPADGGDTDTGAAGSGSGLPRELRSVWRHDGDLFAEVALPDESREQGARYGLHPALLDAVLRPALLRAAVDPAARESAPDGEGLWWPDSWHGVALHASGASVLRVRLRPRPDGGFCLEAADAAGEPVLSVESVTSGRLTRTALARASAAQQDGLFAQVWDDVHLAPAAGKDERKDERWVVVGDDPLRARAGLMAAGRYSETHPDLDALAKAVAGGAAPPDVVIVSRTTTGAGAGADTAGAVRRAVREGLDWARRWADPLFADTRLVVLTRDAVPAWDESCSPDLPGAAVWGLVGAAQDRAPGRFVLVDTDASKRAWRVLPDAVASGEPRLALRGRAARVPRTERLLPGDGTQVSAPGGVGPLLVAGTAATALARHLVGEHGVRDVLLAGPAVADDAAQLRAQGAHVSLAAWDTDDPAASVRALRQAGPSAVLFTVSVDTAAIASEGPDGNVDTVLRPVVDTALALGDGLAPGDVSAFVLSSPATAPAAPGLVAEAVGAFLDAWATHLRATGVPAVSVRGADPHAREARDLFDVARSLGRATVIAARPALDGVPSPGPLTGSAALRRGLVRAAVRRTARDALADPSGLRRQLAALSDPEQEEAVLDLVRAHFAASLGLTGGAQVPPDDETRNLGFDSLTALTARNALAEATGLSLPAAVVFDFATPAGLARHLKKELLAR